MIDIVESKPIERVDEGCIVPCFSSFISLLRDKPLRPVRELVMYAICLPRPMFRLLQGSAGTFVEVCEWSFGRRNWIGNIYLPPKEIQR